MPLCLLPELQRTAMCFPVTRMVKYYSDAYAAGRHAFHTFFFYILIVCVLKSLLQVVVGEHWHLDDTNPDTYFQ